MPKKKLPIQSATEIFLSIFMFLWCLPLFLMALRLCWMTACGCSGAGAAGVGTADGATAAGSPDACPAVTGPTGIPWPTFPGPPGKHLPLSFSNHSSNKQPTAALKQRGLIQAGQVCLQTIVFLITAITSLGEHFPLQSLRGCYAFGSRPVLATMSST